MMAFSRTPTAAEMHARLALREADVLELLVLLEEDVCASAGMAMTLASADVTKIFANMLIKMGGGVKLRTTSTGLDDARTSFLRMSECNSEFTHENAEKSVFQRVIYNLLIQLNYVRIYKIHQIMTHIA